MADEELPRPGERGMMSAIRCKGHKRSDRLHPMARINFARTYTVEHSVKVYDFGDVHKDDLYHLSNNWRTTVESERARELGLSSVGGKGPEHEERREGEEGNDKVVKEKDYAEGRGEGQDKEKGGSLEHCYSSLQRPLSTNENSLGPVPLTTDSCALHFQLNPRSNATSFPPESSPPDNSKQLRTKPSLPGTCTGFSAAAEIISPKIELDRTGEEGLSDNKLQFQSNATNSLIATNAMDSGMTDTFAPERLAEKRQSEEVQMQYPEEADDDRQSLMSLGHESAYSIAQSMSSNTSIAALFPGEPLDFLVNELADFLLGDPMLRDLCLAGVQDQNIGKDRFQRNFHRLLQQFALDLKAEATSQEYSKAASFIKSHSRAVSKDICNRVDGPKTQHIKALSGNLTVDMERADSSSEDGDRDTLGEEEGYSLSRVKEFMMTSSAFASLCDNVRDFVHPTLTATSVQFRKIDKCETDNGEDSTQMHWMPTSADAIQDLISTISFKCRLDQYRPGYGAVDTANRSYHIIDCVKDVEGLLDAVAILRSYGGCGDFMPMFVQDSTRPKVVETVGLDFVKLRELLERIRQHIKLQPDQSADRLENLLRIEAELIWEIKAQLHKVKIKGFEGTSNGFHINVP